MAEHTTAQIQIAIATAIKDKDFDSVVALIKYLAAQDPQAAADTLEIINLGLDVARARHTALSSDGEA
jgi:hypothetical protein